MKVSSSTILALLATGFSLANGQATCNPAVSEEKTINYTSDGQVLTFNFGDLPDAASDVSIYAMFQADMGDYAASSEYADVKIGTKSLFTLGKGTGTRYGQGANCIRDENTYVMSASEFNSDHDTVSIVVDATNPVGTFCGDDKGTVTVSYTRVCPTWTTFAERASDGTFTTSYAGKDIAEHINKDLNQVIHRYCSSCTAATHTDIYYKRITNVPPPSDFNGDASDFVDLFTDNWMSTPDNLLDTDFKLYSTYDDAINDVNAWTFCNYDDPGVGFPRDCGPNGKIDHQWSKSTAETWVMEVENTVRASESGYTAMGCYKDDRTRAMTGYDSGVDPSMTIGKCVAKCTSLGFAYAGLQHAEECFCGNSYDLYGALPETDCNMPCKGDGSQICGGFWAISVYATGNGGGTGGEVAITAGWDNQLVGGDDTGKYFLFDPAEWASVIGSVPAIGAEPGGVTYEVKQLRGSADVWQGTVRIWINGDTRPEIGLPAGFEHGRRDSGSAKGQWLTGDRIVPIGGGGTGGDPHFTTWNNEHFEYHGQCDLTLVKDAEFAEGLGLDIHIRTKVVRYWSYIKNVAIKIGNDILEIEGSADGDDADAHYWINFEYQGDLDTFADFPVTQKLPSTYKRRYIIDLSSKYPGASIVVQLYKEFVRVQFNGDQSVFGNTVGLLGDYKTGELVARDGSTVMNDFTDFGDEWQVLPSESKLFHEIAHPQFPELCIKPEDPRGERKRRLSESNISIEQAEAACGSALTDPLSIKDCVYDILATQDLDMVGAF